MTSTQGLDGFPLEQYESLPPGVKRAFKRWGNASQVVRMYRKRGWNPSAVIYRRDRLRDELYALLDQVEHDEMNPRLF